MTPSTPASVSFFSCALVSSAFSNVLSTVMISSYTFLKRRAEETRKGAWGAIYTGELGRGLEEGAAHFRFSRYKLLSPRKRVQVRCYCVNCELMILATTPSWEPLINGAIIGLPSRFAGLKSLPLNF